MSLFAGLSTVSVGASTGSEGFGTEEPTANVFSSAPSFAGGPSPFDFMREDSTEVPTSTEPGLSAFSFLSGTSGPQSARKSAPVAAENAFAFMAQPSPAPSESMFSFAAAAPPATDTFGLLSAPSMHMPTPAHSESSFSFASALSAVSTAAELAPSPFDALPSENGPRKKTRKALLPGHAGRTQEMERAMAQPCEPEAPAAETASAPPSIPETVGEMPAPYDLSETKVSSPAVVPMPPIEDEPFEAAPDQPPSLFSFIGGSTPPPPLSQDPDVDESMQLPEAQSEQPSGPLPLSAFPFAAASAPAAEPYEQVAPPEPPRPAPPPPPPPPPVVEERLEPVVEAPVETAALVQEQEDKKPSLEDISTIEGVQLWVAETTKASLKEQRSILEKQSLGASMSQQMAEDVAALRKQLAAVEADQNRLCDNEQFEEAGSLDQTIQEIKATISSRLEAAAGASKEEGELASALLDILQGREQHTAEVLEHTRKLLKNNEGARADADREAEKRMTAEQGRLESERQRMELARSHFEKDAENLEEENRQLHDAILSQTSSHVEERDTARQQGTVLDAEIIELRRTLEAKIVQRSELQLTVDSCEIRIASIKSKFEKQLSRLDSKMKRLEETRRDLDQDVHQLEQMVMELDQAQKMCAESTACRDRQVVAMQHELERLQRGRGVVTEQVEMRRKWRQMLQPHRELLNQAMSCLERASGECTRLAESLEAQEAQRDRHRSEIEAIKLQMPSLEAQKKLAVSSRSFKEAGRISEQMRARDEERRVLEDQFEQLQSNLLTSREALVASRQAEEDAQAELLRVETDCAVEGHRVLQQQIVDVVALRKRVDDATGERALLELEERTLRAAQVHLAAKHGLALDSSVVPAEEEPVQVSDVPGEAAESTAEEAPPLQAEPEEASGDSESLTVTPVVDVEAARVRVAELEQVEAVEESFQRAVENDIEEACDGGDFDRADELETQRTASVDRLQEVRRERDELQAALSAHLATCEESAGEFFAAVESDKLAEEVLTGEPQRFSLDQEPQHFSLAAADSDAEEHAARGSERSWNGDSSPCPAAFFRPDDAEDDEGQRWEGAESRSAVAIAEEGASPFPFASQVNSADGTDVSAAGEPLSAFPFASETVSEEVEVDEAQSSYVDVSAAGEPLSAFPFAIRRPSEEADVDVVQTISADCPDVPVEDAECGDRAEDGDGDARHAASPPPPPPPQDA